MKNKLVIIDGSSLFYRSFYALPLLTNSENEYSNAVYGFAIQIINIIENIKPTHLAVAFDVSKNTFRTQIYSEYKATRKPMPDELRGQIEPLKLMLEKMGIALVQKEGLEGDDIIGILSDRFSDNTETIIVTGDRDTFQLIDSDTKVYFTKRGTSEMKIMGESELKFEYGVTPAQFIDVKALQGDTADNIPGVAGIGPKTATELVMTYGSLDGVYENLDKIQDKLKDKLEAGKKIAFMSRELATILREGDLDVSMDELKYSFPFSKDVQEFFKKYEFRSLLKKPEIFKEDVKQEHIDKYVKKYCAKKEELQNIVKNIEKTGKFAAFINNSIINVSYGEGEWIIQICDNLLMEGVSSEEFTAAFKPLFESDKIIKVCFDSKRMMYDLKPYSIELNNYFDCSIAKCLYNGVSVDKILDVVRDPEEDNIASFLLDFEKDYSAKINSDEKLQNLYYNIEIPLSKLLFLMENVGFMLDRSVLDELTEKYKKELSGLENEIYELAGEEFNINSPKQLASILYDKLGLSHPKSQSTSAEMLETIVDEHEIVGVVLRYRKVAKFLSTYLSGMYPHIASDGKVHTYFKQTLTSTGRLSSVEPNLQNIPVRSDESREIRSMFVASSNDNVLIDADYSQIELRLLAHLSGDKMFVDAFNNNEDIHTQTACDVFGVTKDMVTREMRRTAKVVNFGIIYGISGYGLAEDLKIRPKQAREFIDNFYSLHPAVKEYMDNAISSAKKTGIAVTMLGRRRRMDDIASTNFMARSRAERASQNMPLQGSAADIIKIAMINTDRHLRSENLKAKLIMQIHDELIIDAPKSECDKVIKILQYEMENAYKLAVPLKVDITSNYRWSETH